MFGEEMPKNALIRTVEAAAIGSSLSVYPAVNLPVLASRADAKVIIINRESTSLDQIAEHILAGEITKILCGTA